MKKKIFGGFAIVAIAVAVAFNVSLNNQKQDKASMLALANVEALASGEVEFDYYCINVSIDLCAIERPLDPEIDENDLYFYGIRVNNPN